MPLCPHLCLIAISLLHSSHLVFIGFLIHSTIQWYRRDSLGGKDPSFQSGPRSNVPRWHTICPIPARRRRLLTIPIEYESQHLVESSVDDELTAITRRRKELAKGRQVPMLKEKIAALERVEAGGSNILDDQSNVPSDDGYDGQSLPRSAVGSVTGSD
jgi:hypothetical protein